MNLVCEEGWRGDTTAAASERRPRRLAGGFLHTSMAYIFDTLPYQYKFVLKQLLCSSGRGRPVFPICGKISCWQLSPVLPSHWSTASESSSIVSRFCMPGPGSFNVSGLRLARSEQRRRAEPGTGTIRRFSAKN